MTIVVQKFGGTSLVNADGRNRAVRRMEAELARSRKLVAVVSAMGRRGDPYATDTLLRLAEAEGGRLAPRERDLLMSCGELISAAVLAARLAGRGIAAAVLTGGQAGIVTTGHYGDARIVSVDPAPVLRRLGEVPVVIVAGFQGRTPDGEITTLGRGGSDTTAAALAAALRAERIDIYTDVPGVFTADPRLVAGARRLTRVSYGDICQMAHNGAKVIHPRAVELAMQANIPLCIRSTAAERDEGTWVTAGEPAASPDGTAVRDRPVTGIASVSGLAQIRVAPPEPRYGFQLDVLRLMAENGISVDFISMNPTSLTYTVFGREAEKAAGLLIRHGYEPGLVAGCAKVAVIGGGMNGKPGIMAAIVSALTDRDIRILQSADSNATIWVLIREEQAPAAVNALHEAFRLNGEGADHTNSIQGERLPWILEES